MKFTASISDSSQIDPSSLSAITLDPEEVSRIVFIECRMRVNF